MKKTLTILLVLAVMALMPGCGSAAPQQTATPAPTLEVAPETPAPTAEPAVQPQTPQIQVSLYIPNENADGFNLLDTYVSELSASQLVAALITEGVFPEGVAVNSCQLTQDAGGAPCLALDMNADFAQLMSSTGTTGEYLYMGSLVNTLLNALGATYVTLTVDGGVLETGHSIYDFQLTWYENY